MEGSKRDYFLQSIHSAAAKAISNRGWRESTLDIRTKDGGRVEFYHRGDRWWARWHNIKSEAERRAIRAEFEKGIHDGARAKKLGLEWGERGVLVAEIFPGHSGLHVDGMSGKADVSTEGLTKDRLNGIITWLWLKMEEYSNNAPSTQKQCMKKKMGEVWVESCWCGFWCPGIDLSCDLAWILADFFNIPVFGYTGKICFGADQGDPREGVLKPFPSPRPEGERERGVVIGPDGRPEFREYGVHDLTYPKEKWRAVLPGDFHPGGE